MEGRVNTADSQALADALINEIKAGNNVHSDFFAAVDLGFMKKRLPSKDFTLWLEKRNSAIGPIEIPSKGPYRFTLYYSLAFEAGNAPGGMLRLVANLESLVEGDEIKIFHDARSGFSGIPCPQIGIHFWDGQKAGASLHNEPYAVLQLLIEPRKEAEAHIVKIEQEDHDGFPNNYLSYDITVEMVI